MIHRALALLVLLVAACAHTTPPQAEAAPQQQPCPEGKPGGARCWFGHDSAGAHYAIVLPAAWNGVLMLHAHGGPALGAPRMDRVLEDLQRWSIWPRSGYALAASSFRQGGVAVRAAAEDTERLRRIVVAHVVQPRLTILHGQSWGAGVAAKAAEMFDDSRPFDAVLLSSGVLAGGTRAYDFRLDLRVVYQQLCGNHPQPDEPQYPLWMGLPAASTLTAQQLAQRTQSCLGTGLPAAQRTPQQARRLATLARVIGVPEASLPGHLSWATFHFQDIVQQRTGGGNPFGNIGARYSGSDDDEALNRAVPRYRADPAAVARFGADADLSGRIGVPVLAVHAIHDPTAFVEMQATFADTMAQGGSAARLVQVYTDHAEHSYLADPVYVALADALLAWLERGDKPTPASLAARCQALPEGNACRMQPGYRPAPLDSRVPVRERP